MACLVYVCAWVSSTTVYFVTWIYMPYCNLNVYAWELTVDCTCMFVREVLGGG